MPRPMSPPTNLWSPRRISPIIEDRVETFKAEPVDPLAMDVGDEEVDYEPERLNEQVSNLGIVVTIPDSNHPLDNAEGGSTGRPARRRRAN